MAEHRPDDKVASKLRALADEWAARSEYNVHNSSEADSNRRLVLAIALPVGVGVLTLVIAAIVAALD